MNRITSWTAAPLLAALSLSLSLAACQPAEPQAAVEVSDAWVRLPAVPGRPGAAYFTIASNGAAARLASIASPQVERIELHDSMTDGGMMRMTQLASADIPSNGTLTFAPGGKHAMLFGIAPTVKPDDMLPLIFTLADGKAIETTAHVMAAGDDAHEAH